VLSSQFTEYELTAEYGGRAGLSYDFKRLKTSIAYRFVRLNENMDAKSGFCEFQGGSVTAGCRSWWQERGTLGFNSVEFSLLIRI